MKKSHIPWSLKQFVKMHKKGTISFDHPIQRRGDQWNHFQKSLLIHSLIADYPVPPIYSITENVNNKMVYFILDGKQRLTTIIEFFNNEFAVHQDTPSVTIDGKTYVIRNLYYSDLEEDVKDELDARTLTVYKFDEATDEEIEEVFFRLNNGVILSTDQKNRAKLGKDLIHKFDKLLNHSLITEYASFSKLQIRRSEDLTTILQCMMLLTDFKYKNFSKYEVVRFTEEKKELLSNELFEQVDRIFTYISLAINKQEKLLLKKIHFPMTVMQAKKAMELRVEPKLFGRWMEKFKEDYNVNSPYIEYCGQGSIKKVKVEGRLKEMDKHFNAFISQIDQEEGENVVFSETKNTRGI